MNYIKLDDMDKCLIDLYCAVTQIEGRYFKAIGTRADGTHYQQAIETSFTAELYHRLKNLHELPINKEYYQNLILNFDINKEAINGRPDIVLHQAQENRMIQKMFIEVKTDAALPLEGDFNKLLTAIGDYLHFEFAVIIIANRPYANSKQSVWDFSHGIYINLKRKLFLINAEIQVNNSIDYNMCSFAQINL